MLLNGLYNVAIDVPHAALSLGRWQVLLDSVNQCLIAVNYHDFGRGDAVHFQEASDLLANEAKSVVTLVVKYYLKDSHRSLF